MHEALSEALFGFTEEGDTRDRTVCVLQALGYRSERTLDVGDVGEFVELLGDESPLTERQRRLFDPWRSAAIVFQITGDDIGDVPDMFQDFDAGRVKSFLFVAADLEGRTYSRSELADMARTVNRGFPMPVIVLFRHGSTLTLASVHRRAHKRDDLRDVLERVTLVKDIRPAQPHRAHLEILADLDLPRLRDAGVHDFDTLHAAWERVLDIEALNKRFYAELFGWFQRSVDGCSFPDDGAGDGSNERHVIRLVTRLLFVWFLREKGLIPSELFEEPFAEDVLKHHAPERTDYYRAVLQNLFFATLNTEVEHRGFGARNKSDQGDFSKYRYRDLLARPQVFLRRLREIPFVNGGLFDCLDDFAAGSAQSRRIDAFRDGPAADLRVPAEFFLDPADGLFPLFRRYKFTVEENTPLDREVALDPELLGRAFEHLLAAYNPETRETARKSTGSYYTPRQVVDYMVREALTEALVATTRPRDGDSEFWRARLAYLLDPSDAMDDADDLFEDADRQVIVAGIARLRALDPAVGSGAFPMGILQTLTMALRRLDPHNTLWEAFQKERAKARAGEAFDTRDQQQREEALREISETFEKYRESDFGRKLYLIQNSIYGVDIQPIACQIAKLRFFVSLAIEQDPDASQPNRGIKPLPNLETRFIAADALMGLRGDPACLLIPGAVLSKRREVSAVRERYFLAETRSRKLACIEEDQRLRHELHETLKNERADWIAFEKRDINDRTKKFRNPEARRQFRAAELRDFDKRRRAYDAAFADARRVAKWDPYDQNGAADWFESAYMFGVADGFDVVIGNPPYIQLQKNQGELAKRYADAGYETLARRGDIYQLFYERGCRLLKSDSGTLAYITSNSWLKAESGQALREWFAEGHTPLRLIEMGKDVFEAIVDTSILLVREGGEADPMPAIDVDRLYDDEFPPQKRQWVEARPDGTAPWSILSSREWRVLAKMNRKGTPLRDWNLGINYGVKTGYNAAFIVDDDTRDALVTEDPRSDEIIRPILRGRHIRRWVPEWRNLWLIVAKFGSYRFLSKMYPAVYRHLRRHETALRKRGQCTYARSRRDPSPDYRGQHHWLELDNNPSDDYLSLFAAEKLFWMDMSPEARFAYSTDLLFCNDKGFVLTGRNLKFLCGVLNSSLITWMVNNVALTTGEGLSQWKKYTIEGLPIPVIPVAAQRPFVRLVDRIVAAKSEDAGADVTADEEALDRLVYGLYGLTPREIAAVESSSL